MTEPDRHRVPGAENDLGPATTVRTGRGDRAGPDDHTVPIASTRLGDPTRSATPADHTAPTDPVAEVSGLLRAVSTQTDRYTDTVRGILGMNPSDLTALTLVVKRAHTGEAMTASDLAAELHLSPSAVTSLIDRLERVGHVNRRPHAQDGRKVVLDMTDQASDLSRRILTLINREVLDALARHDVDDLRVVASVLSDVIAAVAVATEEIKRDVSPPGREVP